MEGYVQFLPEPGKNIDSTTCVVIADWLEEHGMSGEGLGYLRTHISVSSENVPPNDPRWQQLQRPDNLPHEEVEILNNILRHVWRNSVPERSLIEELGGIAFDDDGSPLLGITYNSCTGLPWLTIDTSLTKPPDNDNSHIPIDSIFNIWPQNTQVFNIAILEGGPKGHLDAARFYFHEHLEQNFTHIGDSWHGFYVDTLIRQHVEAAKADLYEEFPDYNNVLEAAHLSQANSLYRTFLSLKIARYLHAGTIVDVDEEIRKHLSVVGYEVSETFPNYHKMLEEALKNSKNFPPL